MEKIKGGYYIKSRLQQEGEIAQAPPHVREIWDWLVRESNHSYDEKNGIKRGSTVRSLRDMQEGLSWFVGYRKEKYSKSKCEMAMNWLRKRGMITTTKTTRGLRITVCNYDHYQDFKNYETNNEKSTKPTRNQQSRSTINNKEEVITNEDNSGEEKNSSSPKKSLKKNLEERKEEFRAKIFIQEYTSRYGPEMLNGFFNYWAEHNEGGVKMKFEMQETFNIGGRLATWKSREKKPVNVKGRNDDRYL